MLKNSVVIFLLILFNLHGSAQNPQILLFPLQKQDLIIKPAVGKVFADNGLSQDSLLHLINEKILKNLASKSPEINFIVVKPEKVTAIFDSSTFHQHITEEQAKKIITSRKFKRNRDLHAGYRVNFYQRELAVTGQLLLRSELFNQNAAYCIFINRIYLTQKQSEGFTAHYEFYDHDFNLVAGDEYLHPLQVDSKMYFSTIRFYLDYSLENFSGKLAELIKKLKQEKTR